MADSLLKRKKETGYVFVSTDKKPFSGWNLGARLKSVHKKAGLRQIRLTHT